MISTILNSILFRIIVVFVIFITYNVAEPLNLTRAGAAGGTAGTAYKH